MSKRILFFCFCLLLWAAVAQAQDPFWEALIYNYDTNQVQLINTAGISTISQLPANFIPPQDYYFNNVVISPDRRFVAATHAQNESERVLKIADLQNLGNCCLTVANPSPYPISEYFLGPFNPQGTEVAVGYIVFDPSTTGTVLGGIMTIDAASGSVTRLVDNMPIDRGFPVFLREWTNEGLLYLPSCWGCEPAMEGFLSLWHFGQNSIVDSNRYFNQMFSDYLGGTGEMVLGNSDYDFPISPEPAYMPYSNVIKYFAAGEVPLYLADFPQLPDGVSLSAGQVVYHDPANLQLPIPKWVLDGQAFALPLPNQAKLIYRSGEERFVALPAGLEVLMGTPDGFLSSRSPYEQQSSELYHFSFSGNNFTQTLLGTLPVRYAILQSPILGLNLQNLGFAVDIAAPPPPQCPGFLPSRLKVNLMGQVTPGAPNNLRDAPSLSSNKIGEIPGNELFFVLEGPICADGIAWWRVDYQGQSGWTAEGQGSEYWTLFLGY